MLWFILMDAIFSYIVCQLWNCPNQKGSYQIIQLLITRSIKLGLEKFYRTLFGVKYLDFELSRQSFSFSAAKVSLSKPGDFHRNHCLFGIKFKWRSMPTTLIPDCWSITMTKSFRYSFVDGMVRLTHLKFTAEISHGNYHSFLPPRLLKKIYPVNQIC